MQTLKREDGAISYAFDKESEQNFIDTLAIIVEDIYTDKFVKEDLVDQIHDIYTEKLPAEEIPISKEEVKRLLKIQIENFEVFVDAMKEALRTTDEQKQYTYEELEKDGFA